ncbi:DUF6152 family protein [Sphingobium nicotianae]|uniref:Copper chaperone PCu(A)C n=1 Tax=Sphingobium nicotianae TaxID=2782607 RepID=A0A9X1IRP8_9SPHN|nr:DUF6152 family protein [Sphingobium nicotianae]MBT2187696.1 hypothetical protein [Sphingobium nicotianae]
MRFAREIRLFALPCAVAALAIPAAAHHSFAMFDNTRSITIHGNVTAFQWTNPHAYLEIDADEGKGASKHYTLELTSPNMMSRGGWTSRTVKPGDVVTAVLSPLRDGQPGGLLLVLTLPNGKKILPGVPHADRYKITS